MSKKQKGWTPNGPLTEQQIQSRFLELQKLQERKQRQAKEDAARRHLSPTLNQLFQLKNPEKSGA